MSLDRIPHGCRRPFQGEPDQACFPAPANYYNQINIPQAELDLLQRKLELTRLPTGIANEQWGETNGVSVKVIGDIVKFWREKYDWRAEEARLNEAPQFKTSIDAGSFGVLDIHFVHSKSSESNTIPLLFLHGWPGSFAEIYKAMPELNKAGFTVVAPSLPGYGFSSYPDKAGFKHIHHAEVMHKLMQRLGYNQYVVQGGDWGAFIVRCLAIMYPDSVKAVHQNMVRSSVYWSCVRLIRFQGYDGQARL